MNLTRKNFKITPSGKNVSFEDNEFKGNKALNDQGKVKDEGTITDRSGFSSFFHL
jgi:hypothetical protein